MAKFDFRAVLAEFFGTFVFLFAGVGAAISANGNPLMIVLAHGLAIAVMATAMGPISGGHLNPAVSIGFWLDGRLSMLQTIGYIVGQIAGAIAGVAMAQYCLGPVYLSMGNYGIPGLGMELDLWRGFAVEAVLTFALMLVIWGAAVRAGLAHAGLMIGLTVAMAGMVGGAMTGASLNPARYLGPAVVSGNYADVVPYVTAPIFGAALAVLVYKYLLSTPAQTVER